MELPEELMTLILLKLPVKSLLRFKCVQKSWYSLIKSTQFVQLHHRSSSSTSNINYDCFVVKRFIEQQDRHVLSFYSYETLDDLGNEINIPVTNNCAWSSCSCDRLVCIPNKDGQILICNPTIREFRSLFIPPPLGDRSGFHIRTVALGSDPNTGQYKVVMIGVTFVYDYNFFYYVDRDREARLYDFSSDSWRQPAGVIPSDFDYLPRAISFNGAFHWSPVCDSNILTFHISNEAIGCVPMPDFVPGVYETQLCVSTKSQLSLVIYWPGRLEICVMTEYGVKESWTRIFNIGQPLPLFSKQPIVFWDVQHLLLKNAQGQLVLCDLQHQNLLHFLIHGDFDVYPYSHSLVSVKGIGHLII